MDSAEVPRSSAQVGDDAYLHQYIAFSGVKAPTNAKLRCVELLVATV